MRRHLGGDLVQDAECHFDRLRLAAGTAQIELQGVAEAAVVVGVRRQRSQHGRGRSAAEEVVEASPFNQARVEQEESFGGIDGRWCDAVHGLDAIALVVASSRRKRPPATRCGLRPEQ
ncbi:MAG: hypothetical protein ACRDVZ_01535 [Jiangellaceae bacterium]